MRQDLGQQLADQWHAAYAKHDAQGFALTPEAKGARRLRNVALNYLAAGRHDDAGDIAFAQFRAANNMTDRLAAMMTLTNGDAPQRADALAEFYARYQGNALVIDKWFAAQATSSRCDTLGAVRALKDHPDFTLANPNRVRALAGAFSMNQLHFHAADGAGYRFLADVLLALDPINPQTAAKLLPPLGRWKRFDADRQALMRAELERILAAPNLSKDLFEQASKSLAG